ncbi:MAG: hypothetical protein ACHQ9S_18640 [Candidatus Binatia bacterium]
MKWRYVTVSLVTGGLLFTCSAYAADPQASETTKANQANAAEQRSPARIEAAPGGGDMITAGPALQYVTHGRVGPDGRLITECTRSSAANTTSARGQ